MQASKRKPTLPNTTIHLIRHGEVENPRKVYYGRLPRFGLSVQGRAQAAHAGLYLQDQPLDALYTSPMLRARQTAALVRGERDLPLRISNLLNEVHSPYDGEPWNVLEDRQFDVYTGSTEEYEQAADVLARMLRFLRRVRRDWRGRSVAAVSHGSPLAVVLDWARSGDTVQTRHKLPGHASISTLVFQTDDPQERPQVSVYDPNQPA